MQGEAVAGIRLASFEQFFDNNHIRLRPLRMRTLCSRLAAKIQTDIDKLKFPLTSLHPLSLVMDAAKVLDLRSSRIRKPHSAQEKNIQVAVRCR